MHRQNKHKITVDGFPVSISVDLKPIVIFNWRAKHLAKCSWNGVPAVWEGRGLPWCCPSLSFPGDTLLLVRKKLILIVPDSFLPKGSVIGLYVRIGNSSALQMFCWGSMDHDGKRVQTITFTTHTNVSRSTFVQKTWFLVLQFQYCDKSFPFTSNSNRLASNMLGYNSLPPPPWFHSTTDPPDHSGTVLWCIVQKLHKWKC